MGRHSVEFISRTVSEEKYGAPKANYLTMGSSKWNCYQEEFFGSLLSDYRIAAVRDSCSFWSFSYRCFGGQSRACQHAVAGDKEIKGAEFHQRKKLDELDHLVNFHRRDSRSNSQNETASNLTYHLWRHFLCRDMSLSKVYRTQFSYSCIASRHRFCYSR